MTTIAYRDGVLAADTLCTRGNNRDSYGPKILMRDGLLAGASWSSFHSKVFRDWFAAGCVGDCPSMGDPNGTWGEGFIVRPDGGVITFSPHGPDFDPVMIDGCQAWGSGCEIAMGAMLAGATAEDAVAIAIKIDTKSGGEITVLRRTVVPII